MKMNNAKRGAAAPRRQQVGAVPVNANAKRGILACLKDFFCAIPEYPLLTASVFFGLLWLLLVVYEQALLFRVSELSVFLFEDLYFDSMMSVPAGFLSYLGSFMVQFFHIPLLGATLYVLLLVLLYWVTRKAFSIPGRYSLVALLPVAAIVASNTQLGYWIFYLKLPGYYYVALLGVLFSFAAVWLFRKMPLVARFPFVAAWVFFGYPLMGVYALAGAVIMALYGISVSISRRKGVLLSCVALFVTVVAVYLVPRYYYGVYDTVAFDTVYKVGTPSTQWTSAYVAKVVHDVPSYWHDIRLYWIPFFLLLFSSLLLALAPIFKGWMSRIRRMPALMSVGVLAVVLVLLSFLWFRDTNFRVENKQNMAMWNGEWDDVVEYGKETYNPTRQVVLNTNLALLHQGIAGEKMFANMHASADILAPVGVHLTQTGGKMLYYYYGKLNFCYRWCMEDAVEYGWRIEYLKHATRSMILSGEDVLARRYIGILKRTMFYRSWAEEMEKFLDTPELIVKEEQFRLPLNMNCFDDALAVDDSFVEAFLTKDLMVMPENATPEYVEASLMMALIRKDGNAFWSLLDRYAKTCVPTDANKVPTRKLPKHYQEAYLLFKQNEMSKAPEQRMVNVESLKNGFEKYFIDPAVEQRFTNSFIPKVAQFNPMNNSFSRAFPDTATVANKNAVKAGERYNASYFRYDFDDTYYYYFYFVRNIKTN